jgi:hypothetical protein
VEKPFVMPAKKIQNTVSSKNQEHQAELVDEKVENIVM